MKQDQVDRIRESFTDILRGGDAVTMMFYKRLFEIAPDTCALFKNDPEEQGRLLIASLVRIVTGLSHLEDVLPSLRALAIRHVGYGVRLHHYAAVSEAFRHMLTHVPGSSCNPETLAAWGAAYTQVERTMMDAAYGEGARDRLYERLSA